MQLKAQEAAICSAMEAALAVQLKAQEAAMEAQDSCGRRLRRKRRRLSRKPEGAGSRRAGGTRQESARKNLAHQVLPQGGTFLSVGSFSRRNCLGLRLQPLSPGESLTENAHNFFPPARQCPGNLTNPSLTGGPLSQ